MTASETALVTKIMALIRLVQIYEMTTGCIGSNVRIWTEAGAMVYESTTVEQALAFMQGYQERHHKI